MICPRCGLPMEPDDEHGEPQLFCNPMRSPDCWKTVGRATAPHPLTGAQHMLTVIEGGKDAKEA